jgi:hypothetical protein
MPKFGTLELEGASGKKWTFNVWPRDNEFNAVGAVYVHTVRAEKAGGGGGTHKIIYVGQTGDLSTRPLNHHKKACFDKHAANFLLIYQEENEKARLTIEADLIKSLDPPCNG